MWTYQSWDYARVLGYIYNGQSWGFHFARSAAVHTLSAQEGDTENNKSNPAALLRALRVEFEQ